MNKVILLISLIISFFLFNCKKNPQKTDFNLEKEECNLSIVDKDNIYVDIDLPINDSTVRNKYLENPKSRTYLNDVLPCIERELLNNTNTKYIIINYYITPVPTDITELCKKSNKYSRKLLVVDNPEPFIKFLEEEGYFNKMKEMLKKNHYNVQNISAERVNMYVLKKENGAEEYIPGGLDQLRFNINKE